MGNVYSTKKKQKVPQKIAKVNLPFLKRSEVLILGVFCLISSCLSIFYWSFAIIMIVKQPKIINMTPKIRNIAVYPPIAYRADPIKGPAATPKA